MRCKITKSKDNRHNFAAETFKKNSVMTNKENYPKIALGTWSWGTGAAGDDSWFAHLAIEVPGEKTSNEWLEPVTDEEYNKLQEEE